MTKMNFMSVALIAATAFATQAMAAGNNVAARHATTQGSYERYGLCAGSKGRRVCLGSLYCTAMPA